MSVTTRIKLISQSDHAQEHRGNVVRLSNSDDPLDLKAEITAATCVELEFPNFTDGRAYSQAYLLRRRLHFVGDLRATGDVLVDQLIQMERMGFSSAVLKEGIEVADAYRQLQQFTGFYQRDVSGQS